MSTDMLISGFFREIGRNYPSTAPFRERGHPDVEMEKVRLPPYRAVFTSAVLHGYACGYRLPSLDEFLDDYDIVLRARLGNEKLGRILKKQESILYTDQGLMSPGLLHRLSRLYVDGMAHTQLYCAVVQAYEDQRKLGAVFMDTRVDIKLKTDILVTTGYSSVRIDIGAGNSRLLQQRRAAEDEAKLHASGSSERGNPFLLTPVIRVVKNSAIMGKFRGLEVFKGETLDPLFDEIDGFLRVSAEHKILYRNMVGVTMKDLQDSFQN